MAKIPYNTPLFRGAEFGGYEPDTFKWMDIFPDWLRKDKTKLNAVGQTIAGDILLQKSFLQYATLNTAEVAAFFSVSNTFLSSDDNLPIAILAIPSTFGNHQYTEPNARFATRWFLNKYHHNINNFQFYLIYNSKINGDSRERTLYMNARGKDATGKFIPSATKTRDITADFDGIAYGEPPLSVVYYEHATTLQRLDVERYDLAEGSYLEGLYRQLVEANGNNSNGVRYYCGDQSFGVFDDGDLSAFNNGISHWKERSDSVYDRIRFTDLSTVMYSQATSYTRNCYQGTSLQTEIPVFVLEHFDEMVHYFQGEPFESDNFPILDDWSTDWDIYVKGAQKPNIYITMKSKKIDDWLKSDQNKGGIKKEDIMVEYQYQYYGNPSGAQPAPPNVLYPSSMILKPYEKDNYNVSRETSYLSNLDLNYELASQILFPSEFRELSPAIHYQYYAQLRFRLKYDDDHKSAWCRYAIGIIGSPSIPDFALMKNEGVQDDAKTEDGSTVTIHYDEEPPGTNPWPDPPNPPLPPIPGGGTDPTPVPPGLNGIGLLTTTYKITIENAKALGRFFWGGDLFQKIKALNLSPIENVVGLYIMPIDIPGTSSIITIGDVNTEINGDVITSVPLYTVGEFEFKGRYQSFLDFEPYTSAFLFLPFVGFVRIDPAYFTNRTLKVVYAFDIVCGQCNAMLFADGLYIESHQGNCGIEVPLVSSNRAQLTVGLASSLFTEGLSAATTLGTASKVAKVAGKVGASTTSDLVSDLAGYATGFHSARQGGYNPQLAWTETRTCFIVIESVNAAHSSTYNKDKGRPCMASANIGTLHGYTEVDGNVDLSGISGASVEEIEMIRGLLSNGFIA